MHGEFRRLCSVSTVTPVNKQVESCTRDLFRVYAGLREVTGTSGLSKLNFRMSRFGDSHGCPVKTVAIAKTAQSSNPAF